MTDVKWSTPSHYCRNGVHHRYSFGRSPTAAPLPDFINPADVINIRWSKLAPGGFIVPHIDHGPHWTRWHLPQQAAGVWWTETDGPQPQPAEPYKVETWEPHAVWNTDTVDRIIVIVDTAPTIHPNTESLQLTDHHIPELDALNPVNAKNPPATTARGAFEREPSHPTP